MMHGNCKCGHHVVEKILVVLAWLAGIGFVISGWRGAPFWMWNSDGYFRAVVVFVALAFSMKVCGCCWKNMKMMHGGMACPACEGRGGEHTHGDHQHM